MNEGLEPLRSFILPGGGGGAAAIHLARADRPPGRALGGRRGARGGALNPLALVYLNRLSDHLFVMARLAATAEGGEVLWQPGATR